MPSGTHQNVGLLERRIIELLTTTSLTFKEIILKLDCENLSASIGIIRRINRDNRYRRPRYDSKLTPAQRESLVCELRDHQGVKPNLSLLAKRYGVCHGSVWYWWDKLNRIRRCEMHSRGAYKTTKSLFKRSHQVELLGGASNSARRQAGLLKVQARAHHEETVLKQRPPANSIRNASHPDASAPLNLVGRVSIVTSDTLSTIELPILMFGSGALENEWPPANKLAVAHSAWPLVSAIATTAVPI